MTQSPLEPQNNEPRRQAQPATGPSRPLTLDEMVAVLVAFLSLGSVLFWGLSRGGMELFADSSAPANSALTTSAEGTERNQPPFGLSANTQTEVATGSRAQGTAIGALPTNETGSARRELAEKAATRAATREDDTVPKKPMWANVKAGVASAAAGITGVAVTQDAATATPESTTTAPGTAAESTEPEVATADVEGTKTPENSTPETNTEENSAATAPDKAVTETTPAETTPEAAPLSAAATAAPKDAINFSDVPDNYWAKPYIDALSSRDLISGFEEGDFKPDQPVTRAQIANIVSRTFDLTSDKDNLDFGDVTSDYWAKDSIAEVVKGGFMTGFPNNTFEPNAPVTRAQALTTLVTGLGLPAPTNVQTALSRYSDANTVPNWANEKVAAATAGGIVVNYPNLEELNPTEATTRAELSAMIYQALAKEGIVEPVNSVYIVKP